VHEAGESAVGSHCQGMAGEDSRLENGLVGAVVTSELWQLVVAL
jgi:hypothetical protein